MFAISLYIMSQYWLSSTQFLVYIEGYSNYLCLLNVMEAYVLEKIFVSPKQFGTSKDNSLESFFPWPS